MSNLDTKKITYKISMPIRSDSYYIITTSPKSYKVRQNIIMTGITEQQYNNIEKGRDIKLHKDNIDFNISSDDIVCFGNIDFTEGSDDCDILNTFNWFDELFITGIRIPSNYNYETHECTSHIRKYLYTETFDIDNLCRYYHGCLGKPKYTLIFRDYIWKKSSKSTT